jgi:hypothetical protein
LLLKITRASAKTEGGDKRRKIKNKKLLKPN